MSDLRIEIVTPQRHADHQPLLDEFFALRYRVFVELHRWALPMARPGRECDQWDDERATYVLVIDGGGTIIAGLRLHNTNEPTLLTSMFAHLVDGSLPRSSKIWEGTRMLTHPQLPADESRHVTATLLAAALGYGLMEGVHTFVSVSDPFLERVLRRTGLEPRRLGPCVEVQPGIRAVALEMPCTPAAFGRAVAAGCATAVAHLPLAA